MKKIVPPELERQRILTGAFKSTPMDGFCGAFVLFLDNMEVLAMGDIAQGWEHVAVSIRNRPPNAREMRTVRNIFWPPEEMVLQFYLSELDYANYHPNCQHLWRPANDIFPRPPAELVKPRMVSAGSKFYQNRQFDRTRIITP